MGGRIEKGERDGEGRKTERGERKEAGGEWSRGETDNTASFQAGSLGSTCNNCRLYPT